MIYKEKKNKMRRTCICCVWASTVLFYNIGDIWEDSLCI